MCKVKLKNMKNFWKNNLSHEFEAINEMKQLMKYENEAINTKNS